MAASAAGAESTYLIRSRGFLPAATDSWLPNGSNPGRHVTTYRFVHAADLHLDSPFQGISAEIHEQAEILRRATFAAYSGIIDLCLEEQASALLVAGDVFDSADNSLIAQLRFRDGLTRLAEGGIRSFVCHGNHDPLDGWRARLDWPEESHRFGSTPEAVSLLPNDPHSPLIYGVSYPKREMRENLVTGFPPRNPERPAIGLLHANVGADTGHDAYAPCSVQDLVDSGYDYWALGHVHARQLLRNPMAEAPGIVYPGNSQGRHANELGPRGVYVVDMNERGAVTSLRFQAIDTTRWELIEVPIGRIDDEQALIDALETLVETALASAGGRHLIYRIRLTGRGEIHGTLIRPDVLGDLKTQLNESYGARSPFALCVRVKDETSGTIDRQELARGSDFVADLLALIDELRGDPAGLRQLAEEAGLADLYGHARARRFLDDLRQPTGSELASLIEQAEQLLLDGLVEGTNG